MKKLVIFIVLFLTSISFAQEISNYLILSDIAEYKYRPRRTTEMFGNSGILIPVGHFDLDHNDTTYTTRYIHTGTILGVSVQVTQHKGEDSDKWLLHEVEDAYRLKEKSNLGLIGSGTRLREFGNNKLYSLRGSGYNWISNNVVIDISYTDLYGNKPEPIEVIEAYLQKFPSTIPASLVLDKTHDEKWIKDEMERRLWLCDKWFEQLDEGKIELSKVLSSVVEDHLEVFLDYREKYYEISSSEEKQTLSNYLVAQNKDGIRTKLDEYKLWWAQNKGNLIKLP